MAKVESYKPGSFCWAELATTDTAGGGRFYQEMFGWTMVEHPMPDGIYTIFQADGNDAAAMFKAPPGVCTHWNIYFSVTDADAAAATITALGGRIIMPPFDVMDLGRMAVGQDPQGAAFSVWQPKKHIGATHEGPLNAFGWPELRTPDAPAAVKFYTSLFGWTTKPDSAIEAAQYVEWSNAGEPMGGLLPMTDPEWKGVPPHWVAYVSVADCGERFAKAKQLGAKIYVSPTDIPNVGRFAVLADPQGASFCIIQLGLQ
jgi:predicted enzyme related to lactoylglutathione lyase